MKPKYRIQWDYNEDGYVIGYWVWTNNYEALQLCNSFYIKL